jgi:Trk K+ transport system NAD-binding subunit
VKKVLILGDGHLANRTHVLLGEKNTAIQFAPLIFQDILHKKSSSIYEFKTKLEEFNVLSCDLIYILYEDDKDNLEVTIALGSLFPENKIATSLFNEKLIPHLKSAFPNLTIINPARISAPSFVESIYKSKETNFIHFQEKINETFQKIKFKPNLLFILISSFFLVIISSTLFFHTQVFSDKSLLDAFYFVVVTITTVGFGDLSLLQSSDLSKIVGIILMLSSSIFIWLILSLLLDNLFKRKTERLLGRKKYNYKNHIVLCGLGRLGYFIAEELIKKGEQFIIIEPKENSTYIDHFKRQNIDVYIGNGLHYEVLNDVAISNCKAIIAVTDDDHVNLEIGLMARSYNNEVMIVLRIFDESMAKIIKSKFNIQHSKSMSFIAAKKFAELSNNLSL